MKPSLALPKFLGRGNIKRPEFSGGEIWGKGFRARGNIWKIGCHPHPRHVVSTVWLRKCCGEGNTNLLRSAVTVTFASVAVAGAQINSSAPVVRKQFTGLFSFLLPLGGRGEEMDDFFT